MEKIKLSKTQVDELLKCNARVQAAKAALQDAERGQKSIFGLVCDAHNIDPNKNWRLEKDCLIEQPAPKKFTDRVKEMGKAKKDK